jgi:hypothetical protein
VIFWGGGGGPSAALSTPPRPRSPTSALALTPLSPPFLSPPLPSPLLCSRLITCEADKTIKIWAEDRTATETSHPVDMRGWTEHVKAHKYY